MSSSRAPTVNDILKDSITGLAAEHWPSAPTSAFLEGTPDSTPIKTPSRGRKKIAESARPAFSDSLVVDIFNTELNKPKNLNKLQLLEVSCYLEHYLWPFFTTSASAEHVLSIILLVNEKCREGVPAFGVLAEQPEKFESFIKSVIRISMSTAPELSSLQKSFLVQFLVNIFLSLENALIRRCCLQYLSLPIWQAMSPDRLARELSKFPPLKKHWQHYLSEISDDKPTEETKEAAPSSGKKRGRGSTGSAAKNSRKKTPEKAAVSEKGEWAPNAKGEWIPYLLKEFLKFVETPRDGAVITYPDRLYVERFLELVVDLLSQLPTRRFLNALLDDLHFVVRLKRSPMWTAHADAYAESSAPEDMKLFRRLTLAIDELMHFEIQDQTGKPLTTNEILSEHWSRLHTVQEVAHKHYKDALRDLIFSSTGELGKQDTLRKYLSVLDPPALLEFAVKCGLISQRDVADISNMDLSTQVDFAMDIIVASLVHRKGQLDSLNQSPLYPTEADLWDENVLPAGGHKITGESVLALPKLNLQFLTMHDYLLRNYILFKLESSYEIRQDLVDSIKRMAPKQVLSSPQVTFGGWSRMALPIHSFRLNLISKPNIGDIFPSEVRAVVEVDLSRFQGEIRAEWESFKEHDVIFLLAIQNPQATAGAGVELYKSERRDMASGRKPRPAAVDESTFKHELNEFEFPKEFGVRYVRGAEVIEMRDEDDVVLNDFNRPDERKGGRVGSKRRLLLRLDPAQYYSDMKNSESCYETLNLLVRRKPKENNFRAVLDTIRSLINIEAIGRAVPAWLYDVLLGYGNPSSAHYRNMPTIALSQLSPELQAEAENVNKADHDEIFDYVDTFLDAEHLLSSFPNADVTFHAGENASGPIDDAAEETPSKSKKGRKSKGSASAVSAAAYPPPPYHLMIRRGVEGEGKSGGGRDSVVAVSYNRVNMGPYPEDRPPTNTVRYSDVQIEAIRSGMNQGLTLIVGPPGTGKTDVAVQIIVNLYHVFPTQKILLVTHSNAALNDLFLKLMQRDVDQRHLLRLGSGEKSLFKPGATALDEDETFSKQGRVDWSLSRRLELLGLVQRLAQTLSVPGDVGYTCETAEYFFLEHVLSRIERFRKEAADTNRGPNYPRDAFPFKGFFSNTPVPLFAEGQVDAEADSAIAEGCFRHVIKIFEELKDYRAFELLRTQGHRADYLLTKQARIVAMTCTHAAMTRSRLVELGFKYDSLVMEEAAQILEVETLIPMLLQNTDAVDGCRLKRAILIGDHNQLPPVVKHPAFQRHSKLDQSMFTRFIRLGVPAVQLDRQGRARAEIASLYSWRYTRDNMAGLQNLSFITNLEGEYGLGNAGFLHNYQLIDVPDFKGRGEFSPTPYFYQNLGEAEYVVAVFQYMRLLGYPASKISILTSYNGQKNLIRDVVAQRCQGPLFGHPAAVTTVDKYQGQQNDYILLSLVRTETVGHIRDVRRLVVALSRARLGLYVFCRQSLFENCYELIPAFNSLLSRPTRLQLVAGEGYPSTRRALENGSSEPKDASQVHTVADVTEMGILVYQMVQQAQHMSLAAIPSAQQETSEGSVTLNNKAMEVSSSEEEN